MGNWYDEREKNGWVGMGPGMIEVCKASATQEEAEKKLGLVVDPNEPKPCPFCGSASKVNMFEDAVTCDNCDTFGPRVSDRPGPTLTGTQEYQKEQMKQHAKVVEKRAIELWNNRA